MALRGTIIKGCRFSCSVLLPADADFIAFKQQVEGEPEMLPSAEVQLDAKEQERKAALVAGKAPFSCNCWYCISVDNNLVARCVACATHLLFYIRPLPCRWICSAILQCRAVQSVPVLCLCFVSGHLYPIWLKLAVHSAQALCTWCLINSQHS